MMLGNAMHQGEPRTHCTSVVSKSGSKNLILIPNVNRGAVALMCEKHRELPILIFYGKCQPDSVVLGSEHKAY